MTPILLYHKKIAAQEGRLDLSSYPPGLYFLKDSSPKVEKVVIME
jgi:hypothetical protein